MDIGTFILMEYTLKYSVESYAATVTDSKLKKVTDAMMRYGNSAKAYSGKQYDILIFDMKKLQEVKK